MPPTRRGRRRGATQANAGAAGRQLPNSTTQPVPARRSTRSATVAATAASRGNRAGATPPPSPANADGEEEPLNDLEYLQGMIRREIQQALAAALPQIQVQPRGRSGRRQTRATDQSVEQSESQEEEEDTSGVDTGADENEFPPIGQMPPAGRLRSVAVTSNRTSRTGQSAVQRSAPTNNSQTNCDSDQQGLRIQPDRRTRAHQDGVILSSALRPIPGRLVRRIREGEFVEMRDLLADNITLHEQLESIQGPLVNAVPVGLRPRVREVPTLISWVYCYLAYLAVTVEDQSIRDRITYGRLIVREALRHGGQGWQEYDRNFRSQAAIDSSLRWNGLLPDLQAATMLGQRSGGGTFCSLCRGVDHIVTQCALGPLQQPLVSHQAANGPSSSGGSSRGEQRRAVPVCTSWNSGRCAYPGRCSFRHVCITCGQRHMARDCRDTPQDSQYKRGLRPPANAGSSGQ